jgi:phage gpG-like protein
MAKGPNRAGFKVTGLKELNRALQAAGADIEDLKDAFGKIAAKGAQTAKGFTRSRSGRLRGSIRGNRAKSKAVVTAGRASVPYAGPVNYGWPARSISPSEFMQRTDDAMRPVALDELTKDVRRIIRSKGL